MKTPKRKSQSVLNAIIASGVKKHNHKSKQNLIMPINQNESDCAIGGPIQNSHHLKKSRKSQRKHS